MRGQRPELVAAGLLEALGQLAADRGRPLRPEDRRHVAEARRQPPRELVEDQRRRHRGELGQAPAAGGAARRREAGEEEAVGRQPRHRQRREQRRGARHRRHRVPGGDRLPREPEARVGDERRAGVGDQRHRAALRERRQQPRPLRRAVVVVVGQDARRPPDPVDLEQPPGVAGVLGGEHVGPRQHVERPERDVARVADRGGDEIEPGAERRGVAGRRFGPVAVHSTFTFRRSERRFRPPPARAIAKRKTR